MAEDWITHAQNSWFYHSEWALHVYCRFSLIQYFVLVESYSSYWIMWILNYFLYPSKVDNFKWLLGFYWVMHWKSSVLLHLQFPHVWVCLSCAYPGSFFSVTSCICVLNHNVLNFHTLTQIVTFFFCFVFFKHAQFRSEEAVLKVWTAALLKGQCSALGLLTAFVFRFCSPNCSSYSALLFHFHHDQWERQKARAARP